MSPARGGGSLWLGLSLLAQFAAWWLAPPPAPVTLRGVAVGQAPFGEARSLDQGPWPAETTAQLAFHVDRESWVAVLWFSGDGVRALYPDGGLRQGGRVAAGRRYAIPAHDRWLALTPGDDAVYVVAAAEPWAAVVDVVEAPTPARVAALRATLAGMASPAQDDAVQWLPTADGRAVALAGRRGFGRPAVLGWQVAVR